MYPDLSDSNKYYIFTSNGETSYEYGFRYSIVDISLDNGNGDIIIGQKNRLLYDQNGSALSIARSEKITSYYNSEENIIWIVLYYRGKFLSFKLDENGLNDHAISSTTILLPFPMHAHIGIGSIKISPDGSKLATAFGFETFPSYSVLTTSFDESTGQVSPAYTTIPIYSVYGLEFSPNSQYLYMYSWSYVAQSTSRQQTKKTYEIYQYDLKYDKTFNSERAAPQYSIIATGLAGGSLQLALDNKIYYNNGYHLGVIHNPNEEAANLNVNSNYLNLNRWSNFGLPQKVPVVCQGEWPVQNETNAVKNKQITADSENNIYLLDIKSTNNGFITYLSKYNFCGEELWSITISDKPKQTFDVQVDADNNVVLTHHTSEPDIYNNWYYIEKYSPDGTLIYKYGFDRKPIAFDINKTTNESYLLFPDYYTTHLNIFDNNGNNVFSTNILDFLILKINSDNSFNTNIQSKIHASDPLTQTFGTRINDIEFSESTNQIFITGIVETSIITIDDMNSFSVTGNNQIYDTFVIKYHIGFGNIIYNSNVVSDDNFSPYDTNRQLVEYNESENKLFIITGNTISQFSNNLTFEQSYQISGWGTCDTFFNQNENYLLVGNSSKIFKIKNGFVLELIDEFPNIQHFGQQYSITQTPNNYIFSAGLWNEPIPPSSNVYGVYIDRFNEYGEEARINPNTFIDEDSNISSEVFKTEVSPNPFTSQIKIETCSDNDCLRSLTLLNSHLIEAKNIDITKTVNYWLINTSDLDKGLYFLDLRYNNGKKETVKLIKE